MASVTYTPAFVRQFKKLPPFLQQDVVKSINHFEENPQNPTLRFHKLKGKLKGYSSFSVNYQYRIIVEKDPDGSFALLTVGDHSIYD